MKNDGHEAKWDDILTDSNCNENLTQSIYWCDSLVRHVQTKSARWICIKTATAEFMDPLLISKYKLLSIDRIKYNTPISRSKNERT
jgi:hypothetical protein